MATETRVPQFCLVCGSRLVHNSSVTGYDPYTGEALQDTSLSCNNPTVTVNALGRRSTIQHPTWTNYNGEWSHN